MDQTSATPLPARPGIPPGPYTVDEYYRLAADGLLRRDDRVELIEGELVWMNAIGSAHASAVIGLVQVFGARLGGCALLSVQNPIRLDDGSEPQPDVMVLAPRADRYREGHPRAHEVLLLIEVSDSSLAEDRGRKRVLYARHGIVEYWIVNLDENVAEVCRNPGPDGYPPPESHGPDARLAVEMLPGLIVPVREFLP